MSKFKPSTTQYVRPGGNTVAITLRLPPELWERLSILKVKRKFSTFQQLVEGLIYRHMPDIENGEFKVSKK